MPRLAPGCDPTSLPLTPAEAYLLTRVDGSTPFSQLIQIGGLPPEEAEQCLQSWLEAGVLVVGDAPCAPPPGADTSAPDPPPGPEAVPEAEAEPDRESAPPGESGPPEPPLEIDPALEIAAEDQQRIIDFGSRLERSYYDVLGVAPGADAKAIKRAYFKLSREFHPDRYFRREIGPYEARLHRIFKKIVEAYELLSDPATRAELDRSLAEDPQAAPSRKRHARGPRPFGVMAKMLRERKKKAKRFYEAGKAAFKAERWLEASASVRLAIAFDPQNEAYKEGFSEVVVKANAIRSAQILTEAEAALDMRRPDEALALYEEALHLRPHDPEVNHTAARLALVVGTDLRKAKEYAATACEVEPDKASHHRLLGQIYKAANLTANARREIETALRLDPKDKEAKAELKRLKRW
ncbi:MAG: DnaJ domain-containing protein [Deltaproteobacteria bacterium]|nr:MAG: DnaJ domain-containing protein [Deltaproteobacteria bacterium]